MKRVFVAAVALGAAILASLFTSGCSTLFDRRVEKELTELTAASCAEAACRLSASDNAAAQRQLAVCDAELKKGCLK